VISQIHVLMHAKLHNFLFFKKKKNHLTTATHNNNNIFSEQKGRSEKLIVAITYWHDYSNTYLLKVAHERSR
jgi:hypothetical protein